MSTITGKIDRYSGKFGRSEAVELESGALGAKKNRVRGKSVDRSTMPVTMRKASEISWVHAVLAGLAVGLVMVLLLEWRVQKRMGDLEQRRVEALVAVESRSALRLRLDHYELQEARLEELIDLITKERNESSCPTSAVSVERLSQAETRDWGQLEKVVLLFDAQGGLRATSSIEFSSAKPDGPERLLQALSGVGLPGVRTGVQAIERNEQGHELWSVPLHSFEARR